MRLYKATWYVFEASSWQIQKNILYRAHVSCRAVKYLALERRFSTARHETSGLNRTWCSKRVDHSTERRNIVCKAGAGGGRRLAALALGCADMHALASRDRAMQPWASQRRKATLQPVGAQTSIWCRRAVTLEPLK